MIRLLMRSISKLLLCGLVAILLIGCEKKVSRNWQEEVELSDGTIIWVDRKAEFVTHGSDFLTGEGGMSTGMLVSITLPENPIAPPPPVWSFDAVPIVLDYDAVQKTWVIIGTFFYCHSWSKAGRPPLKHWQYVVKDNQWIVVPLDKKYIGRKANLLADFTRKGLKLVRVTKEDREKAIKHLLNIGFEGKTRVIAGEQRCDQSVNYKAPY